MKNFFLILSQVNLNFAQNNEYTGKFKTVSTFSSRTAFINIHSVQYNLKNRKLIFVSRSNFLLAPRIPKDNKFT